ncbi:MAG: carbon starvation protein A [Lentisphaeria bacterium]|nr:carbon starvation protein A [Lentisphaeria bacterium]
MLLFLLGLVILVVGYFTYGKFVEKILAPTDNPTPAVRMHDGVDFVELPHWKNMLIQLLNIAGIGPVIGVILGIKFGAIVFIILPIGNIIGGAVHDFLAGIISIRNNGCNLPKIVEDNLGKHYARFFNAFMSLLLLLVVAVFINVPAALFKPLLKNIDVEPNTIFWIAVTIIFIYYIIATLFPVDKIIGSIYPIFGAILIISSFAIFIALMIKGIQAPEILTEGMAFKLGKFTEANNNPILPVLFVTIACGIISGFHATQSPIIARTMKTEREARSSFYGMMVLEGIIGMIWAGAGMAIYNLFPHYMLKAPALVLNDITTYFLGSIIGGVTVIGVIILAITSGDTAMRSLRLSVAETFKISQKSLRNRILLCLPLIAIVFGLLYWSNQDAKSFNILWNYFSWANQILAATTLLAATVWLIREKKFFWIAAVPGVFMTFIIFCYILWTDKSKNGPLGFGLDLNIAYVLSTIISIGIVAYLIIRNKCKCSATDDK